MSKLSRERKRLSKIKTEGFYKNTKINYDSIVDELSKELRKNKFLINYKDVVYPESSTDPLIIYVGNVENGRRRKIEIYYDDHSNTMDVVCNGKSKLNNKSTKELSDAISLLLSNGLGLKESFTQRSTIDWLVLEGEIYRQFDPNTTEVYIWENSDIIATLEVITDKDEVDAKLEYNPWRESITIKGCNEEFYSADDIVKWIKEKLTSKNESLEESFPKTLIDWYKTSKEVNMELYKKGSLTVDVFPNGMSCVFKISSMKKSNIIGELELRYNTNDDTVQLMKNNRVDSIFKTPEQIAYYIRREFSAKEDK